MISLATLLNVTTAIYPSLFPLWLAHSTHNTKDTPSSTKTKLQSISETVQGVAEVFQNALSV